MAKRLRDAFGRFRKQSRKTVQSASRSARSASRSARSASLNTTSGTNSASRTTRNASTVSKLPFAFGYVYSPDCSFCRDLKPEWSKFHNDVLQKYNLKGKEIGANHDLEMSNFNEQHSTNLKSNGFPTIFKLQQKNKPIMYYDDYYRQVDQTQHPPFRTQKSMEIWLLS